MGQKIITWSIQQPLSIQRAVFNRRKYSKFILFWRSLDFKKKVEIVRGIIGLPAVFFHEMCHMFFALFFFKFTDLQLNRFMDVHYVESKNTENSTGYHSITIISASVWSRCTYNIYDLMQSILISTAPVIGWYILMMYSSVNTVMYMSIPHSILFLYCIVCSDNAFFMSAQDISNTEFNANAIKRIMKYKHYRLKRTFKIVINKLSNLAWKANIHEAIKLQSSQEEQVTSDQ